MWEAFSICALVGVVERTRVGFRDRGQIPLRTATPPRPSPVDNFTPLGVDTLCHDPDTVAHSTHEHSTQNGHQVRDVIQIRKLGTESLVQELRSLDWFTGLCVFHRINWIVRLDLLDWFVSERARHHVSAHHCWHHELEARPKNDPPLLGFLIGQTNAFHSPQLRANKYA